jgi:uncharacterized Zn-finger protein
MADNPTPKYQNDMGLARILTGAKEFECIGAKPPFDHPHIFIDMGADDEAVCPYCSTVYKHDPALKDGACLPAEARYKS